MSPIPPNLFPFGFGGRLYLANQPLQTDLRFAALHFGC
jgi:hypothetical protein